jgi:SAM-dependent methyltransferase
VNVTSGEQYWQDVDGTSHGGKVLGRVNDFAAVDCRLCGFTHVLPLPSTEELNRVYADEYYSKEKPFYIERYQEDKDWWNGVYAERYERLEQYLPREQRRMLDVGSGPGLFLALGRERGWLVKGIEPSSQAARYSRECLGLDVDEMFLTPKSAARLGRFDAINLGEVLEHLPDPASMLDTVHGLLVDGGVLCLVVPNDFNPIQSILSGSLNFRPWWLAPPHHLNYFNGHSPSRLVERKGFEVISLETTFPLDLFLLMGLNYIGNDTLGRVIHGYRMQLEKNLWCAGAGELKRNLYAALASLGLGREIVLFARKRVR